MSYRRIEFDNLNGEFLDASTILLDSNSQTIDQLERVLDCYNSMIIYAEEDYETKRKSTKEYIVAILKTNRITLQRCFEKLHLPTLLPGKLLSTIHYLPSPKNLSTDKHNPIETLDSETQTVGSTNELQNSSTQTNNRPIKMPQTAAEFLKLASSLINYKYEGDPLKCLNWQHFWQMLI